MGCNPCVLRVFLSLVTHVSSALGPIRCLGLSLHENLVAEVNVLRPPPPDPPCSSAPSPLVLCSHPKPPPNESNEEILARFRASIDPSLNTDAFDCDLDNVALSARIAAKGKSKIAGAKVGGKVGKKMKSKKTHPYSPFSASLMDTVVELARDVLIQDILAENLENVEHLINELVGNDPESLDDDDGPLPPDEIERRGKVWHRSRRRIDRPAAGGGDCEGGECRSAAITHLVAGEGGDQKGEGD